MVGGGRHKENDMSEKKLIIGTANFFREYRGYKVPQSEQDAIWDYCRQVGIDTVDTATAYGDIKIPEDFQTIMKLVKGDLPIFKGSHGRFMVHHRDDWDWFIRSECNFGDKIGLSIYTPADLRDIDLNLVSIIQLPINIDGDAEYGGEWKNKHCNWLGKLKDRGIEIHARSIFGGRGLAERYGVEACLKYVMDIPEIDKIVVGVETLGQLKEIVDVYTGLP